MNETPKLGEVVVYGGNKAVVEEIITAVDNPDDVILVLRTDADGRQAWVLREFVERPEGDTDDDSN